MTSVPPPAASIPRYQEYQDNVVGYTRKAKNAQITAVALAAIAILVLIASMVIFGLGMLPPTTLGGLGFITTLSATLLTWVGGVILLGASGFGVYSAACLRKRDHYSRLT